MTINSTGAPATAPLSQVTASSPQPAFPQAQQNRALSQAVRVVNNSSLIPEDRQLSLSLDPLTKIAVAKVVDPTTGEVLNQFPAEDVLRLAAYLEAENAEKEAAQETPA